MFEREIRLNTFMYGLLPKLLHEVDEARFQHPLVESGNSPAWILAHLAVVNDYCLKNLGEQRILPAEWHKRFRPGAKPQDDPSPLPSKAELLETLEKGRRQIGEVIAKVDPARMEQPQNSDFFKDSPIKTIKGRLLRVNPIASASPSTGIGE